VLLPTEYWNPSSKSWQALATADTALFTSPSRPSTEGAWSYGEESGQSLPRNNSTTGENNLPDGSYFITAVARDLSNNLQTTRIRVMIEAPKASVNSPSPAPSPAPAAPVGPDATSSEAASPVRLSSASASGASESVRLVFSGAVALSSGEVGRYTVLVNGKGSDVERASLNDGNTTVVLTLAEGSVATGDRVSVHYALRDAQNRVLEGDVAVTAR
jgi:hypothetical protein